MSDAKSTVANYKANMVDGVSGPANDAAKALENLAKAIKRDETELGALSKAMKNLRGNAQVDQYVKLRRELEAQAKAHNKIKEAVARAAKGDNGVVNIKAYRALTARAGEAGQKITELQAQLAALTTDPTVAQFQKLEHGMRSKGAAISAMQSKYVSMGGTFDKTKAKVSTLKQAMSELQKGLQQSPSALGRMSASFATVIERMGAVKKLALGLTIAFAAVSVGIAVYTKRLFEAAIAGREVRRDELLQMEALTRQRSLWGFKPGNSKEMQASIDRIAPSVSIARGELVGLQQQLYQAGARGKNLDIILEAAAIKQSALGSAAGSAFAGFATSVALAGGNVVRMAQDVKNRFGDVVAAKMKSSAVQALKLKEAQEGLFSSLEIEGYLTAQKRLNDVFDQNTKAGRGLKSVLTSLLQPLVNAVEVCKVALRRFFKQMVIGALEIQLAFLQVRIWWLKTFGPAETKSIFGDFFSNLEYGRWVVYLLAAAFGALAVGVIASTWPVLVAGVALWGIFEVVSELYTWLSELDWRTVLGSIGSFILDGLTGGILDAVPKIKEQILQLGADIRDWFAQKLEIKSPSRVFARLGMELPRGLAQGIEQGKPKAKAAAEDMTGGGAPTGAPAARGGGAATINITINVSGANKAETQSVATSVRRELESVLAGLSVQLGAARG